MTMTMFVIVTTALLLFGSPSINAFVVRPHISPLINNNNNAKFRIDSRRFMALESQMISIVSAAAGAAFGAWSQRPYIEDLEEELANVKAILISQEENIVNDKVRELEEKLFLMDEEFEGLTADLQQQYDSKMRLELEKRTEQIKQNFEFKIAIQAEQAKQKQLQEKLENNNTNGVMAAGKEAELMALRIREKKLSEANDKLEQALDDYEEELGRLRGFVDDAEKNWFTRFTSSAKGII